MPSSTEQFVLVPSPFLGISSWRRVAQLIDGSIILDPGRADTPDRILRTWRSQLPDRPHALAGHSNAGLYLPSLASSRTTRLIYLDAALPGPGRVAMVPAGLADQVSRHAVDGLLTRWTDWWPTEALESVFRGVPSDERARLVARQPRLPAAYLQATLDSPHCDLPSAYIGFGDTYSTEQEQAVKAGWPVRVLPGQHLLLLSRPHLVAKALITSHRMS